MAAPAACDPDDHELYDAWISAGVDRSGDGGPVTVVLCGAYELDPARAHPILLGLPDLIHLPADPDRHPELCPAMTLLAAESETPHLDTDAAVPALLDTLLLYILRIWFRRQRDREDTTGRAAALNDPPVTAALHAVHQDPPAPWTVAKLAAEAGLSRAPFARRFAALVGQPPLGCPANLRRLIDDQTATRVPRAAPVAAAEPMKPMGCTGGAHHQCVLSIHASSALRPPSR
ncbi:MULTISPECIES: cupin domain-containing protein [Streptomyces]|uniref:cupin domain-containing protein n=1 Tax=Streptomyces TaxID=1883 RepID=UPI001F39BF01|nr:MULTISPECIES: cupin domain-containing protein [Streptomyces]